MNTLTKETARSLAKVINNSLSTCYSDDLVAILGTGRESTNEQAVHSWLMSRFASARSGLVSSCSINSRKAGNLALARRAVTVLSTAQRGHRHRNIG
ncbi:MAG: hypothetical protein ACI9SK_001291 [Zhongshania sp.]|jgi:hypothetical protein